MYFICISILGNVFLFNLTIELLQIGQLNCFCRRIESLFVNLYARTNSMLELNFGQLQFQHAQLENFPLYANSHTALQIISIGCEFSYLLSLCKAGLRYVDNLR